MLTHSGSRFRGEPWHAAAASRGALVVLLLAACLLLPGAAACAAVDLAFRAGGSHVCAGDTVTFSLWATCGDTGGQSISSLDAVVVWDSLFLDFVALGEPNAIWLMDGFPEAGLYGLINADLGDGDALYSAMAVFGKPVMVTHQGVPAVDFLFLALQPADKASVWIVPSREKSGQAFRTAVFSATEANRDVRGSLIGASVTIVPEPCSLAVLLLGLAGAFATSLRERF